MYIPQPGLSGMVICKKKYAVLKAGLFDLVDHQRVWQVCQAG